MIKKSQMLIATSRKLEQMLLRSGKRTKLLTHGVDLQKSEREQTAEHPLLTRIPRPRAGYIGLLDDRSNLRLLEDVARNMPEVAFVFTGPVAIDAGRLRTLKNVYFTGAVRYEELPSVFAGIKVLFLPYAVNAFTDSISPLKLKEYLASGLPIVSTPMAEVDGFRRFLHIAASTDEWIQAIQAALSESNIEPAARKMALEGESWESKAEQFLSWCEEEIGEPGSFM